MHNYVPSLVMKSGVVFCFTPRVKGYNADHHNIIQKSMLNNYAC